MSHHHGRVHLCTQWKKRKLAFLIGQPGRPFLFVNIFFPLWCLINTTHLSRFHADVDVDHQLGARPPFGAARTLTTLVVCPLYISAAYRHLHCFSLLLAAGAQPDYNYNGPVSREALAKGLASCLLDAVLRHGCEAAFVRLLLDHGAEPSLVPWEQPHREGATAGGRERVDPEALQLYLEARSE